MQTAANVLMPMEEHSLGNQAETLQIPSRYDYEHAKATAIQTPQFKENEFDELEESQTNTYVTSLKKGNNNILV